MNEMSIQSKKAYIKPALRIVLLHSHSILLCGSSYGMNDTLQEDEVYEAW